jgi:hypothetical protein
VPSVTGFLTQVNRAAGQQATKVSKGDSMLQPKRFRIDARLNNNPQIQVTLSALVMAHDVDEARENTAALLKELHLDGVLAALPQATIQLSAV